MTLEQMVTTGILEACVEALMNLIRVTSLELT